MEAQRDIQELGEQRDPRHESTSQHSLETLKGNIFQCDHCYKIYPIISKLRDHMSQAHLSLVRYKCGKCSFLSYHRAHMTQHWHSVHSGPPIISDLEFPCEICSKKFSTEGSLRKHISRRHSDLLQCPLCVESRIFRNVEALRVHFLSLHGMEPWENHQFSKYTQTLQHVSKVNRDPKLNKYFCYVCKVKSFIYHCKLFTHIIQTHYKIYPFDCELCLFQTTNRQKIQEHYLDDHPDSGFRDLFENKVDLFSSKQKNMPCKRKRKQGENSSAEIKMENIVKEFEIKSNSSEMVLEETMEDLPESENKSEHLPNEMCDENTSTCKICQEICLKEHSPYRQYIGPVHGNTKYRFQCVQCDFKTYSIVILKYHVKAQHITSLVENKMNYSDCQFCWKILKPGSDMETHAKENHSSDLACVECGEIFTRICLLRDHFTKAHGFQKYVEWIKDKIYEVKKRVEQMNEIQLTCYICEKRTFRTIYKKTSLTYHILKEHFQVRKLKCKFCSHQSLRILTMCQHIEKKHNDRRKCEKPEDLRNFWEPMIIGQEDIAKSQIAVDSLTKVENEELMDEKSNNKQTYRCPKCSFTTRTTSVLDLKLHLQMNHYTQEQIASPDVRYLFPCKFCRTNYWSQNNLDIHTSKNHSLEICCPICEALVTVDVLKAHFKSLHGEVAWIKHKNAIIEQIGIKVQNLHNNPSTGYVRCSICSMDFKNKDSVFRHVMTCHFTPRKKILKCEHCSYVCTENISLMKNHMIKHHYAKIIPILGAETILYMENGQIDRGRESTNTKKLELSSTSITSSDERTAKAFVCSKNSSVKKGHVVKKHSTSNIPILGAETIFYTETNSIDQRSKSLNTKKLDVSSTRAVNSKALKNDCSKRNTPILGTKTIFYRINHPIDQSSECSSKLDVYSTRTASSEEQSIECYICGQEFCNENALMIHIEEMHSDISLPYFCQLCHEFFTHEFSFETHWYLAHCETQPLHSRIAFQSKSVSFQRAFLSRFPCKFCNTYFATEAKLALHEESVEVHPNVYLCFLCEFLSEFSQAVRAHIKVKHPSHNAHNLTELCVVDESTPVDGNESTDLSEQLSSITQSIRNQSKSIPDLTVPSCIIPSIKVDPLDLDYTTVTDCPEENLNSEFNIKQEMDLDEITIKEEELTTFSEQCLNETLNQPGILEGSNFFTAYSTQVSHPENPTPGFNILQFERVEHNVDFGVAVRRDPGNIVETQDEEIKQERQVEEFTSQVGAPRGKQRGWDGVEPPQRGQGHVVGRCKRKVGGIKGGQRVREGSRNPRGESSQLAKKSRPGPNFVQEAVSPPTPALTCLTTAPVYSGTSSACCSPDLLAGSGAQGRRVTSRPYPDSLPPVPGGCLPCSVQL